jgi:hypothetical protein
MKIIYLILTGLLFLNQNNDKDQNWKLRKEEEGIIIYTRSVAGSSFDEFKANVSISNTSLEKVLGIILDANNYTGLIADCSESKILMQKGKYYDIHYFRINAPWPIKDRDAIYESVTTLLTGGKQAHVSLSPRGNYLAEKENLVRMYHGVGYWELEEVEKKTVKITYQFHGNPAGLIPALFSNSVIVANPFKTLQNLKKRVAEIDSNSTFSDL